jgi:hypothetical protein
MLNTCPSDIVADVGTQISSSRPIYIDGRFGWLHTPITGRCFRTAVLLCAGLKEDKVTAHRSFRILADSLAGAGYPTLRFDYTGTGDSRDIGTNEPWETWRRDIQEAANWLRCNTGV